MIYMILNSIRQDEIEHYVNEKSKLNSFKKEIQYVGCKVFEKYLPTV